MRLRPLVLSGALAAGALTALGAGCGAFSSGSDGSQDDAGTSPVTEAGSMLDGGGSSDAVAEAAPPGSDPGVYCSGGTYCNPQSEVCCTVLSTAGNKGCLPKADASTCLGLTFACDDGADCTGGNICCSTVGSDGRGLFGASCVPLTDCKKDTYWVVVCDPLASGACPDGVACNVPDGGGYGFCDLPR